MPRFLSRLGVMAALCAAVLGAGASAQAKPIVPDSPEWKSAKDAMASASVIVLGQPYTDAEFKARLNELVKAPYNMQAEYDDGLMFTDAVKFIKLRMKTNYWDQVEPVSSAYLETMGRQSTEAERAYWVNRVKTEDKWWYATLVPEFAKYLNNTPTEKQATIERAYRAAFGRSATADEIKYWMPRKEHYRLIRDANRQYLWGSTPAGHAELMRMLTDLYHIISKQPDSVAMPDNAYQFFLFLYEKKKATYEEIRKDWPAEKAAPQNFAPPKLTPRIRQ